MSILKPSNKTKKTQIRVNLDDGIISKINAYCEWSGIKKIDEFVEQAAEFVFKKDRDWRKQEEKALKVSQ